MKLSLNRSEFAEAVKSCQSVIAARTPKPILQCVLLETCDDRLVLSASDLEIGLRCTVDQVEIEEPGKIVIPADKLSQIVSESADELLRIEAQDNICHIRGQDSHFQIFTRDVADFTPVVAEGDDDFELKVGELKPLSDWTVFAAARENTRYAINGVLWEKDAGKLTLVATDGRRLARAARSVNGGGKPRRGIVPIKAMHVISRVLTDPAGTVGVAITANQILLHTAKAAFSSALLEGHFPNYEEVIPSDCDKKAEFETAELLSAVRRASLLSNDESKGVKLSFTQGKLTLSSRTPEQGEAVVEVPVEYTQGDVSIGFNPAFLTDVLRVTHEDRIVFEFKEPNRPGLFRGGEGFLYVVMPVNLT